MPSQMPAILQAVMKGQFKAQADAHYPCWHLAPVTGLMNDPNGFCWSEAAIICFISGIHWIVIMGTNVGGTGVRTDLLHWQHEPLALMPDKEYDRNGCYSGSAVNNQAFSHFAIPVMLSLMMAAERHGNVLPPKITRAGLIN